MVHGWMKRDFKRLVIRRKKKGEASTSLSTDGIWVADILLRQNEGKLMLGKYLGDKKIPWRQRRHLGMALAGMTLTASQLKEPRQDAISRVSAVQNSARGPR